MNTTPDKPAPAPLTDNSTLEELSTAIIADTKNYMLANTLLRTIDQMNHGIETASGSPLHPRRARVMQQLREEADVRAEGGKVETVGDIRREIFPQRVHDYSYATNARAFGAGSLDNLHRFLSERGLTPEWTAPHVQKAFKKQFFSRITETQLVAQVNPETPVAEFCHLLSMMTVKQDLAQPHQKEYLQLERELAAQGCKTVRDVLRLPLGKAAGLDVAPHCRKTFEHVVAAINGAFEISGQNIY